jgi:hypothetical protein
MMHTSIILAIQEAEIGRISVPGQLGKKFMRPHLNKWPVIIAMKGSTNRREVQASRGIR